MKGVKYEVNKKKGIRNWMKICIGLVIIAILFANPYTRPIIHFILPLGSGIDDIIVIIALVWLVAVLIYRAIIHRKKVNAWMDNEDYNEEENDSSNENNNLNSNFSKGEKVNEKES
jgi:hypothetical protein